MAPNSSHLAKPSRRTASVSKADVTTPSRSSTPVSRTKIKGRSIADLVSEDRKGRRGSLPHTGSPFRFPLTPSSASRYVTGTKAEKVAWWRMFLPTWPAKLTLGYVLEAPTTVWETVEENFIFRLFDERDGLGWAVGIGCNGLHLFIRLCGAWAASDWLSGGSSWWAGFMDDNAGYGDRLEEVKRLARESDQSSGWMGGWFAASTLLSLAMVGLSFANAYHLVTRIRPYRLHHRSSDDPPLKSPNAHLIPDPTFAAPPPPSLLSRLGAVLWLLIGRRPSVAESEAKPGEIIQLDVWDPPEWNLRVFVLYSPPNALLLHGVLLGQHFPLWLVAMAFITAQTHLIVAFYSQLVKDRATVQTETMREYNLKFVHPRTSKYKKDACVMTSSAEFIRRDEWT